MTCAIDSCPTWRCSNSGPGESRRTDEVSAGRFPREDGEARARRPRSQGPRKSPCPAPRRHLSFSDHQGDIRGALPGLLEGLQGEWPDLMAAMAVLALLLEDRRHIPGERWRIFPPGRLITHDWRQQPAIQAANPSRRRPADFEGTSQPGRRGSWPLAILQERSLLMMGMSEAIRHTLNGESKRTRDK